jgi:hypothetical protein
MTKSMGATIGKKLDEMNSEDLSPEQTSQACGAYGSITGGQTTSEDLPAICQ